MSDQPKPKHRVILQPSGRRGWVEDGQTLRAAARDLGVEIESVCAEMATCGKCKILVEEGSFSRYGITSSRQHLSPVEAGEAAYFEKRSHLLAARGWEAGQVRLSCQARVHGDVLVHIPEESRGNKQIVRKAVIERPVVMKPAMRKYYVEVPPPTLADARGDWERLSAALAEAIARARPGEEHLPHPHDLHIDYPVLKELGAALRLEKWKLTVTLWNERQVIRLQPGYQEELYGAAVDVGSTTIALYLCDLHTGEVVASAAEMNPQIVYGEDIMSRIQFTLTEPHGLATLHWVVIELLNKLLGQAARQVNVKQADIAEMVLVGNTTMHHLLLNIPPGDLGRAPYVPALQHSLDLKASELGLEIYPHGNIHVLPIEASFVGADNVAVLIAEEPYRQDENWLIIDIGTNAELVLGNRQRLVCTSTPTGPALEGAHIEYGMRAAPGAIERVEIDPATLEPRYQVIGHEGWISASPAGQAASDDGLVKGICGSAIIDAVAEMYRVGIIDASGKFNKSLASRRVRDTENGWEYILAWEHETSIGRDIPITHRDVRQIQLAKAALYTAARTLLVEMGLQTPDKILLAGAFGSYIDKTKAMLLGMIPDCPLENVFAIGNAAGEGARIALLNVDKRREAAWVARSVQRYELPVDPSFQERFLQALYFPNQVDPFPHIAHLLPPDDGSRGRKNRKSRTS